MIFLITIDTYTKYTKVHTPLQSSIHILKCKITIILGDRDIPMEMGVGVEIRGIKSRSSTMSGLLPTDY